MKSPFFSVLVLLLCSALHGAEPLKLTLPTDNRALLENKPEDYYMWVPRNFDGESSRPWTAGQYGFVRTLVKTDNEGIIPTKFHEGLDIKPLKRDSSYRPLDEIYTIAGGTVVYINAKSGGSNYGKYIVIEHNWGDGPFFSLYAHLSEIKVELGQRLLGGAPIAVMGYTGKGITRERSHLHLELNMLANANFDDWHQKVLKAKNPHGPHNGMNLIGIDIASLFIALQNNPDLSIPDFLKGASPYFKVAIPRDGVLEITQRYPWLKRGNHDAPSSSWELSFTGSGIPLSVSPSHRKVTKPTITYVRTTRSKHSYYTRGRLLGEGRRANLSNSGLNFIALFTNAYTNPTSSDDS